MSILRLSITCKRANPLKPKKASLPLTKSARRTGLRLSRAFPGRNLELLDLFFDFVNEVGGAGAVDDAMIKSERERNDLCGLLLFPVNQHFLMSGADKQGAD